MLASSDSWTCSKLRLSDDFPKPLKSGDRPAHKALTEWVKAYYVSPVGEMSGEASRS